MKINASGYIGFKNKLNCKSSNILLHGPDKTIIDDTAEDLIESIKQADPKIKVKLLSADQIQDDPSLLMNQMDLFSDNNDFDLFIIDDIKDKHLKLLQEQIDSTPSNRGYIFKGPGLTTRSKLVKLFVESEKDYVLGVYDVNINALKEFCREIFKANNMLIDERNALSLIDYLGYDRTLIKSNSEKIFLYYLDDKDLENSKDYIEFEECKAVISSKSSDELDSLIKTTISGDVVNIPALYEKTISSGNDYILILRSFNYRLNRLLQIANGIDNGQTIDAISTKMTPPIFFKEKDEVKQNMRIWDKYKLSRAINILYEAELDIKTGKENIHNNIMRSVLNIAKIATLPKTNKAVA